MTTPPLVQAEALRDALASATPPLVFDVGYDLADRDAGRRAYMAGHLPGATYLHLEDDLSARPDGRNGRHPLPARSTFAATVGRLGIAPGRQVVVYDRQGAMFAARAWWMLRWLGHAEVAVLDGGYAAWTAIGGGVATGAPSTVDDLGAYPLRSSERGESPDGIGVTDGAAATEDTAPTPDVAPTSATSPAASQPTIDADDLQRRLGATVLLDARAPERFRGDVEPLDAQAGHIPGARNRPFKDNLGADGRFKPTAALRAEFAPFLGGKPPSQVVHQCGSGVTACHNLLAMEAAGLTGSVLYPGSWSEWSSDPARPIAIG